MHDLCVVFWDTLHPCMPRQPTCASCNWLSTAINLESKKKHMRLQVQGASSVHVHECLAGACTELWASFDNSCGTYEAVWLRFVVGHAP